jgi:hypothetical protein
MRQSQSRQSDLISWSAWHPRRAAARSPSSKPSARRGKAPRHKHPEAEIFRVFEGQYLYEMDGRRFYAEVGDVVSIPGGAEHGFVNVTDKPARQYIFIFPALDAVAFFTELARVMRNGVPHKAALNRFGAKWRVEFLGPPLTLADQPTTL